MEWEKNGDRLHWRMVSIYVTLELVASSTSVTGNIIMNGISGGD